MAASWTVQTWLLVFGIVLWGAVQYGLVVWTLRDLVRRPRVRGGNKVLWGLAILTMPIVGALLYASIGPTSFLPRPERPAPRSRRSDPPPTPPARAEGRPPA